jgi:threonine dehydrogenase-like Zn-dependent dehydrogenase
METAVNFVMDAQPLIGERALVLGLGVVGLLTLRLLRHFPLAQLAATDGYAKRKEVAKVWGADTLFSPEQTDQLAQMNPDLILELSSNPAALATAINLAGYGTRIIIGSWYGDKPVTLPLGGPFHRNRIQISSSQVSTIDGRFSNRWSKARSLDTAWSHLHNLPIDDLVTHRFPIYEASRAYQLLDQDAANAIQVLLTY